MWTGPAQTKPAWIGMRRARRVPAGDAPTGRVAQWAGRHWVDLLWSALVGVNTVGILVLQEWATVPFHFIWISLSLLYGWRVWRLPATLVALALAVVVPGLAMLSDVLAGKQQLDELTEIPLMATVFLVMVWYVRRTVSAGEEIRRVSEHNLALLNRQRQFVQDASHVLRTPLTIALGHSELARRTTSDPDTVGDLDVIIDELHRLKRISDQLLALAATEQPDFLHIVDMPLDELVRQAWSRWSATHSGITLGPLAPVSVPHDPARLRDVLDELINNAIRHTPAGTPITLSVSRDEGGIAMSVSDRGPGVRRDAQAHIFDRFRRLDGPDASGLGLGLALVKAIVEAHGGRVSLRGGSGQGATFVVWLPLARAVPAQPAPHPITGGGNGTPRTSRRGTTTGTPGGR
jgi:signal transduction histidine kinase